MLLLLLRHVYTCDIMHAAAKICDKTTSLVAIDM